MKLAQKAVNAAMKLAGALSQGEEHHNPNKTVTPGMPELLRSVAAQGAVLLKNSVLPLAPGTRISVFGRVQTDYFYTGYGSGGDVNAPYRVSLLEGLRNCELLQVNEELAAVYEDFSATNPVDHGVWGFWPRSYPEMPLDDATVKAARAVSDQAVIVLGRSSGEDRDSLDKPGSYRLTDGEQAMLNAVTAHFPHPVLLLNTGSLMNAVSLDKYDFGAVLMLWQGGMESGNAAADLLCGKVCPSGRLTDTVARSYADYPSAASFGDRHRNEYREDIYVGYRWFETFDPSLVCYPFGYGLSYTKFSMDAREEAPLRYRVTVTNTGDRAGKETAMLYVSKPCGVLGNPARELVTYAKTRLLAPGESQTLTLEADRALLASFDEGGLTGNRGCFVLQPGQYRFCLGGDVRSARPIGMWFVSELQVISRHADAAAPQVSFPIRARQAVDGGEQTVARQAVRCSGYRKQRILDGLPPTLPLTGDKGYKLKDVKEGRIDLDTFVAQLSPEELEAITRGGYIMDHPLGPKGNAGIFGGVTQSLRDKGIPPVVTTDGPSGIRLYDSCSLLPIGTLLACTYDRELLETLFHQVALEMGARGTDVLLAPGMNIHRDPLCGRNFEYFSEDPVVSGLTAAAVVRGIQSTGLSACPKHFACNNQEYRRHRHDAVVSQRALREIYLRGFELCVKQAAPRNIMTSYNKINGAWGHYHYDLVAVILRGEWGYQGNVITDWWMQPSRSPEFPSLRNNAYRVRAQVDVLMPGGKQIDLRKRPDGTLLRTCGEPQGITLGEIQLCAKHVLQCVINIKEL